VFVSGSVEAPARAVALGRGGTGRGTALVRDPSPQLADGIVTHLTRTRVDVDLAGAQHRAYLAALAAHGWRAMPVGDGDPYPDGVFVEDTAVVVGELAVLTRPGAPERRGELGATQEALTRLGLQLARIRAPGTLDGGDVLQVGRTVYVGRGGRTNGEGIRQLRSLLAPLGRTVVPVSLRAVLHLKSAVTALPDGTLLGLPDLVDAGGLPSMRRPPEEQGAHVVPLGDAAVLLSASAPRTAEWLDDLGFDVVVVDVGEFEKLEGCVTCLSVLLPGVGAR
jgi:dimethylargininase